MPSYVQNERRRLKAGRTREPIAVKRGQVYLVRHRGPGKKPVRIRVTGVSRAGGQPRITYDRITPSGRRVSSGYHRRWLQFRRRAWRLPESWELQKGK